MTPPLELAVTATAIGEPTSAALSVYLDPVPIGVQLYGNFAREDLLLQVAAQVERARPEWFGAVPPVHVTAGD